MRDGASSAIIEMLVFHSLREPHFTLFRKLSVSQGTEMKARKERGRIV
jgi:hypothetical protein